MNELMQIDKLDILAKDFGISRLQAETGLSRSHIYSILNGTVEPTLETAQKILNALGYRIKIEKYSARGLQLLEDVENPDYIRWCLAHYGAPLIVDKQFSQPLAMEKTLSEAVEIGQLYPDINTVLPYFVLQNYDELDFDAIFEVTINLRYLGYLLNIVAHLSNNFYLYEKIIDLRKGFYTGFRWQKLIRSGKITHLEKKKFKATHNPIADAWKYYTADSIDDIQKRMQKWEAAL